MKEIYRITKGELISDEYKFPFYFGIISEENGLLHLDLYIEKNIDLNVFIGEEKRKYFDAVFHIESFTEEKNKIVATELWIRSVEVRKSKITIQSRGHLLHSKIKDDRIKSNTSSDEEDRRQVLYYIELEGLKMKFLDRTQTVVTRDGVIINEHNDWKRDHTIVNLVYTHDGLEYNTFKLTFFKVSENENIIVSFPNSKDQEAHILYYDIFKEIKRDFISLLSLLNGAEVEIRKEYIGGFFNTGVVNSQTIITYSFESIHNIRNSDYIPLNKYHNHNILNHAFSNCFDKYISENKALDFNSIIFYLNGVAMSNRIEEMFFVLIVAFERLAYTYVKSKPDIKSFFIKESDFDPIKEELMEVLTRRMIGENLKIFMQKIENMNEKRGASVKFHALLDYAKIKVNPNIKNIIKKVRHTSIHEGNIGKEEEGLINYLTLDKLLRDIILNIIDYKSVSSKVKELE